MRGHFHRNEDKNVFSHLLPATKVHNRGNKHCYEDMLVSFKGSRNYLKGTSVFEVLSKKTRDNILNSEVEKNPIHNSCEHQKIC